MPYRRRYRRRRRRPYRRRRRPITYSQMGNKVYRDLRWLKSKVSRLNVEVKHADNTDGFATTTALPGVAAPPTLNHMCQIGQGDATQSRDGNSIKLLSAHLRINLEASAGMTVPQRARVIMVRLHNNNNSSPSLANTLDDISTGPRAMLSLRNLDHARYIEVLFDKVYTIKTDDRPSAQIVIDRKLSSHVKWSIGNTGGNITDTETGTLAFFVFSDTAATSDINYFWKSRVRYVDN